MFKKFLKLKWTDKIRNEQLWERTGQVPIQTEIGRRRWKWVGHTLRKGKNSITRQALQWNPQGSRGRGRPPETWRRCMEREMKDVGMTWVALSKKAQDRDVWRMFVCGLYPDRGTGAKAKESNFQCRFCAEPRRFYQTFPLQRLSICTSQTL